MPPAAESPLGIEKVPFSLSRRLNLRSANWIQGGRGLRIEYFKICVELTQTKAEIVKNKQKAIPYLNFYMAVTSSGTTYPIFSKNTSYKHAPSKAVVAIEGIAQILLKACAKKNKTNSK